ncbi:MAG: hypothetical protein Q8M58_00490, partial [Anaerolineales bacterium]|nr:hypothetical protein [Anaerolineales bacterium]
MYESHLSRQARDRYGLESLAFQSLQQTRGIAAQMNVSAADLYALGLIDEVLRLLLRQYEMQHLGLMGRALDWLDKDITPQSVHKTQVKFAEDFPPAPVYRAGMTSSEYIASESGGIPRRQTSLEELLLLYLHNANAAAMSLSELFDDTSLQEMSA